jgi:hypothetical protein
LRRRKALGGSFGRARVQLIHGEQLRRVRALGEARTELTSATPNIADRHADLKSSPIPT